MGAATSILEVEASKPINCSDIKAKDAKEEVKRLRTLLKTHQSALTKIDSSTGQIDITKIVEDEKPKPKSNKERPAMREIPNFDKYDNDFARCFDLNDSPTLKDYLLNSFYRFCGDDGVLEWDEFWRLVMDMDLGLKDKDIAELRQKCDTDQDGFVSWTEMIDVFSPLLGKFWQASLAGAPEFEQWSHLHWEKHSKLSKTDDGYTKVGHGFWVNKLTGESSWTIPPALEKHPSFAEATRRKKERHTHPPPSLNEFLKEVFNKYAKYGTMTVAEFWHAISEDLHMLSWFNNKERKHLSGKVDINKDGTVTIEEFLATLTPSLNKIFGARADSDNAWIALEHEDESSGDIYLYWYNRITGESSWTNPLKS